MYHLIETKMTSFYSEEELKELGLKSYGKNVLLSRKCSIYGASDIEIGDNVRIDDFCILSGKIILHNNIHISAYCALYGAYGIELEDFSGLSPRCTVFSASDDFSGEYLIGPIHPKEFIHVIGGKVIISKYSQVGAGTIILPGVVIGEGSVVGSMSFVNRSLPEWSICFGVPAKKHSDRSKELLKYEY